MTYVNITLCILSPDHSNAKFAGKASQYAFIQYR